MMTRLRMILHLPADVWQMFVTWLPGPVGIVLRRRFWKRRLRFLGERVVIETGVTFQNPRYIALDDHCHIDRNVAILAGPPSPGRATHTIPNAEYRRGDGDVYIGKRTHIANNCVLSGMGGLHIGSTSGVAANSAIYSYSHHYRNLRDRTDTRQYLFSNLVPASDQSMILGAVFVDDCCAVGLNCVILPGTCLKKGTWVASGSVVSGIHGPQALVATERRTAAKSLGDLTLTP